jgi:hypothetical protein
VEALVLSCHKNIIFQQVVWSSSKIKWVLTLQSHHYSLHEVVQRLAYTLGIGRVLDLILTTALISKIKTKIYQCTDNWPGHSQLLKHFCSRTCSTGSFSAVNARVYSNFRLSLNLSCTPVTPHTCYSINRNNSNKLMEWCETVLLARNSLICYIETVGHTSHSRHT